MCAITIHDKRSGDEIAADLTVPVLVLVYAKSSIHMVPLSLKRAVQLMQGKR